MILALNTSTIQFSLAIMSENGTVLAECLISPRGNNFKGFMPSIESLFISSKVDTSELNAIAVSTGPGSFTGLRVGLSVAKGMAKGLDIPVIGVSCLESLVYQLPCSVHPIGAILTSRKGEVFIAVFKWNDAHEIERLKEDTSVKIDALSSYVDTPTIFIGNDYNAHGDPIKRLLGDRVLMAPPHLWNLNASCVGALGIERFNKKDFDDARELVPSYLRPPDIRPNPFCLKGA